MDPIEIFRTGRHTAMGGETLSFGEAELAAMVAAYDPALHEAPIVVGHPAHDAPAYGWIGGLSVAGDRLQAAPRQVDTAFAEMVRAGRFKRVSASFYTPDAPANPKPGAYYLRHVGFLGAQPPAVKGLKPVAFAAGDEGVVEFADGWTVSMVARLFRGLRDMLIAQFGQERADAALPPDTIAALTEQAAMDTAREMMPPAPAYAEPPKQEKDRVTTNPGGAQPSPREAELAAEVERLRAQAAQFAEAEAVRRRADDAAFLEGLVAGGRLLPAVRPLAAGLLDRLSGGEAVAFAEGREAETPRDALRALLSAAPQAVHYGEVAGGQGAVLLPETASADAVRDAALAFQEAERAKGKTIDWATAVLAVTKGTR